jgi:hypothetical protein
MVTILKNNIRYYLYLTKIQRKGSCEISLPMDRAALGGRPVHLWFGAGPDISTLKEISDHRNAF